MEDDRWKQLVADIEGEDIEAMVDACERLSREAEPMDIPRLLELLKHDDFVVREASAWPLVRLGGPEVILQLFVAYQRGFDEGHDNDGFTGALIELAGLQPEQTRTKLLELAKEPENELKDHAEWLLGFC